MLDLETLGTDPVTAPIIQATFVPFELDGDGPADLPHLDVIIDAESNWGHPFHRIPSAGTLKWWLQTNPMLLTDIMHRDGVHLAEALQLIQKYFAVVKLDQLNVDGLWANGPTFDIAMIESAFSQNEVVIPWSFRVHRCVRTMNMIAGDGFDWDGGFKTETELNGEAHDALVDCHRQIRWVQQVNRNRVITFPEN